MRRRLLLTTAVLSVALGAGGIALAQDRGSNRQTIQPDRMQKQNKLNENRRPQTSGQAPSSTQQPSSNQTQSSPPPQASSAAHSNQPSSTQSPSSAQGNQPSTTNQPSAQNNQPTTNRPSAAQSNRPSSTQQPSSAQTTPSTQQPSSAQTAPSNQMRQPSTATGTQSGQQPSSAQQRGTTTNRQAAESAEHGTRLSASLKSSQRTRLNEAVTKLDVRPVTNVNFSLSVGTAVPTSVTLHPVPAAIVDIIPQYRGYDYFVVRDEVVIVEPRSHKIVDVIEHGGARAESTTATTRKKLNLSSHDREIIRKHYSRTTTTGSAPRTRTKVIVGEEVPESVEIHSFPAEVYREVPAIREYRYIQGDSGTYLVEPGSRRVIEELD